MEKTIRPPDQVQRAIVLSGEVSLQGLGSEAAAVVVKHLSSGQCQLAIVESGQVEVQVMAGGP